MELRWLLSLAMLGPSSCRNIPLQIVPMSQDPPFTNITVSTQYDRQIYFLSTTEKLSLRVSERLQKPSAQAPDCLFASNAGPFNADGSCVGKVIVNHRVIHEGSGVGFGATSDSWVLGSLTNEHVDVDYFVTGFDWLVYQGQNVAPYRNNTTGATRSARTAIGVDANGRLIIVVADGCEKWYVHHAPIDSATKPTGPTLTLFPFR